MGRTRLLGNAAKGVATPGTLFGFGVTVLPGVFWLAYEEIFVWCGMNPVNDEFPIWMFLPFFYALIQCLWTAPISVVAYLRGKTDVSRGVVLGQCVVAGVAVLCLGIERILFQWSLVRAR